MRLLKREFLQTSDADGSGFRDGLPARVAAGVRLAAAAAAFVALILAAPLVAQEAEEPPAQAADGAEPAAEPAADAVEDGATGAAADRTELNLLGEVDSQRGEGRRNENLGLTLIDNNVLRDLNTRIGTTATFLRDMKIEQSYWGAEFGGPPSRPLHLPPARAAAVHGNLLWTHNNSIFSARSFFQVGEVQPARSNDYGFSVGTPLWRGGAFTLDGSQVKNRGQVNGNVLVPSLEERTPLTNDPRTRPLVQRILDAYPAQAPNRTDINPRALNTNAPQDINNNRLSGKFDQNFGGGRITAGYNFVSQRVDAFQLVGGQNPNTTTRNHQARLTWSRAWTPATTTDFTAGFDRVGSTLLPDETSFGPWIRIGGELTSLGPPGRFPVDRAQNQFRYAARAKHVRGKHNLAFGFSFIRRQVNGAEFQDHRGLFVFRRNFGQDGVTTLRLGRPSRYFLAVGSIHRGFRNWLAQTYVGDDWKASQNLTLSFGLRWEPVTRPTEVNDLTQVPYDSDRNNLAPRFGFAYRLPGRLGALRSAYGIHYGEIFTATYIQARLNPPQNVTVDVQAPDMADPLGGLDAGSIDRNARSTRYAIAPDLATPYTHTYNFSWELEPARDWKLELGYVGSRSHKLLAMWFLNRARPVEGVPQTTRTVNQRRPDLTVFDILHVTNGSRGYYDAAKVRLRIPEWAGFGIEASYWFSKAIDLGGNYTNTAANANRLQTTGPSQYLIQEELRGLSNFDQPHAVLWNVSYRTPAFAGLARQLFGNWQLSTVVLGKSGAPFSVVSGSDAPGFGNVDGTQNDNPILLDTSILGRSIDDPDTVAERLPKSAFGFMRPTDARGNLGRNTFRRDGIFNINMALSKRWALSGDQSILFRVESLNVTNHPQFAEPGGGIAFANFGQITNTLNDGRTFKFTLRYTF